MVPQRLVFEYMYFHEKSLISLITLRCLLILNHMMRERNAFFKDSLLTEQIFDLTNLVS